MNRNQKIVLLCALGFALLIGFYPPWLFVLDVGPVHDSKQAGYCFLLSPPEIPPVLPNEPAYNAHKQVHLDFERIEIEWATLFISTTILLLLLKTEKPKEMR